MFQLCNFWRQNIGKKCARKTLMKLTPARTHTQNENELRFDKKNQDGVMLLLPTRVAS
jgi:hypothetical protein